jgi:hypothetical protein
VAEVEVEDQLQPIPLQQAAHLIFLLLAVGVVVVLIQQIPEHLN